LERALEGREPVASAAEPELTPEAALAAAEAELASATALRKATQRRVRELEKREARMKTARDAAKSRAKEAAKSAARVEEAGLDARGGGASAAGGTVDLTNAPRASRMVTPATEWRTAQQSVPRPHRRLFPKPPTHPGRYIP